MSWSFLSRCIRCFLLILVVLLACERRLRAQSFLNGSFEATALDSCAINLPNDRFNALVEFTTAFGQKNEVDVLTAECGYGPAAEGEYYLALNAETSVDAVALQLADPLTAGHEYLFTFFQKAGDEEGARRGVEIGLSDTPGDFGNLIFRSSQPTRLWEKITVRFFAPQSGGYLTVRASAEADSWVMIDGFAAACPDLVGLGNDTTVCRADALTLSPRERWDTYRWQDGSTAPTLLVPEPGTYSVEVSLNNCVLRDSLEIREFPNQCRCTLYLPTAFSPNGDGTNDVFVPLGPCPLAEFELSIFDRWGTLLFHTSDPMEGWSGTSRGSDAVTGTYVYTLKYRFAYAETAVVTSGYLSLVR